MSLFSFLKTNTDPDFGYFWEEYNQNLDFDDSYFDKTKN